MNLHEELGQAGADATAGSGERLASVEVGAALGARVRRGRRRRTLGGAGAVAGVAVVAVGLWTWLPWGGGGRDVEPAASYSPPEIHHAVDYRVADSASVVDEVPLDLRTSGALVCGDDVVLQEGVTVHDRAVLSSGVEVRAASQSVLSMTRGNLDQVPEGEWDNLTASAPSTIDTATESHVFQVAVGWQDGDGITVMTAPLLLRGDQVVGVGVTEGGSGGGAGGSAEASLAWTPLPGECPGGTGSASLGDGVYEPVLVTQVWSASLQTPLATMVVSAGDIEYTGLEEAPPWVSLETDDPGWSVDHLATVIESRDWSEDTTCAALLADSEYVTSTGGDAGLNAFAPLPIELETGRLYGYGDDALVGGYPIPVSGGGVSDAWYSAFQGLEATVLLRPASPAPGVWVFDAEWTYRDDLPHDDAGWFVSLSQVWDCGEPDLMEPGRYNATLVLSDAENAQALDLTPVTVVGGVPSIPEVEGE
ncbi:hypothetical protein [Demequina sp. NBRC 110057]|uniref:hypothetical protein n=1 Tax=Demequina sp. NBRC 110057 TaxID=1570346 RepID=UPI000A021EFF|nr:hypothetical protein [Demequina sp. NBRC 110057]